MAYYTHTRTNSTVERALSFMANVFQDAALRYAKYRIYNTTLAELRALSDRELNDLGLNRTMLRGLAKQAAEDTVAR